ncbi:hypothetical protein BGZ76_010588 [Entomortierella beljakovae]|nr:hypothetical protein BGZ76_010588 [Entomortierella beljakovae]
MGCSGSKGLDNGSSVHHRPHHQQAQVPYSVPQHMLPQSTLPQGWISQFDANKQHLYYVYTQTGYVTWEHPYGPAAHAQETARFYQIMEIQRQQYGHQNQHSGSGHGIHRPYADSYNRMGGGAAGMMMGGMMMGGMYGDMGGTPAEVADVGGGDVGGGDFGGDFGGGDFGGGDFGGGF